MVTEDSTKTHWNGWMSYSPKGVLGLVWRTNTQTPYPALSPYTIWAAISYDDGANFSTPILASQGSPAALPGAFSGGNIIQDFSAVALDDLLQRVYIGWGGWNTGERNIYFTALPYKAFFKGPWPHSKRP